MGLSVVDLMHALPVGDDALAIEFARVAAIGDRMANSDGIVGFLSILLTGLSLLLLISASMCPSLWYVGSFP